MYTVYTWSTPNGYKIPIMLEECGLNYEIVPVNLDKKEQHDPSYVALNPNGKIPTLVDPGMGLTVFESGAILLYLAERSGKFLPTDTARKYAAIEWLMFQMGSVGPMLGQAHHFRFYAKENIPYAIDRYTQESARIYGVLESRLAGSQYLAGEEYSIADIATYPWIRRHERHGQKLEDFPHVKRWYDAIDARPAVVRALQKVDAIVDPLKAANA